MEPACRPTALMISVVRRGGLNTGARMELASHGLRAWALRRRSRRARASSRHGRVPQGFSEVSPDASTVSLGTII